MTQEERELFDLAVSLLEESLPIVIAHGYNDFRVRVHKGAIAEITELLEREDEDEDEAEEAQRIDDASWRP